LCILNAHGHAARGADIIVDASLNPPGSALTVVLNTAQAAAPATFAGAHPAGSTVPVQRTAGGAAYVAIRQLPPSEVLVLTNHP
jgi:hypothetical protein